jgi:hypothetical protein
MLPNIGPSVVRGVWYRPRSAVTTWFAVGTFCLADLAGTYRTRQAGSGPLVAAAASVIGDSLAVVAALVPLEFQAASYLSIDARFWPPSNRMPARTAR